MAAKAPVKAPTTAPAMPDDRRYRAEDAVRTLTRAEEIKRDPKLMADVKAHAAHQAMHLKKIARSKT